MTIFRRIVTRVFSTIKSEIPSASAVAHPPLSKSEVYDTSYKLIYRIIYRIQTSSYLEKGAKKAPQINRNNGYD